MTTVAASPVDNKNDVYAAIEAAGKAAKTVNQWLDDIDYSYSKKYVPSQFSLDFINFIKLVNGGEGEENKTPILHYVMLDQFGDPNESSIANMIHRGAAKTTIFGEYLFLYAATYGKIPGFKKLDLAIYVSDSIENGVKNMRLNLEFRWENSEFLQKYVPKTKFTVDRWEFTNIEGKKLVVKGYGAKTGVRGVKEMGKRPQLAILDDLVSDEDARSPTVIKSIEDTVYSAIEHAMHPKKQKIVWSGTPFNANDPLYKAVESGGWRVNVYPVCERFPCTREEFKGSWPDRFNYDYIMAKYVKAKQTGKLASFYQELMLRITSEDEKIVFPEDIAIVPHRSVLEHKSYYNYYITTDFATSEDSANDLSTAAVWAVNHKRQKILVDGFCKRQTMDKNMDQTFDLVRKWNPLSVGIEVSGQQKGYIPWVRERMMNTNTFFSLARNKGSREPGIRSSNSKSKFERFLLVLPDISAGMFMVTDKMEESELGIELREELGLATLSGFRSKCDDAADLITMTHVMDMHPPSAPAEDFSEHDKYWGGSSNESSANAIDNYMA